MVKINSENLFTTENCENKEWTFYKYNVCVAPKHAMTNTKFVKYKQINPDGAVSRIFTIILFFSSIFFCILDSILSHQALAY